MSGFAHSTSGLDDENTIPVRTATREAYYRNQGLEPPAAPPEAAATATRSKSLPGGEEPGPDEMLHQG